MIAIGTLSCLGYGPLAFITLIGMPFLDFFDFLTNSLMMPISAITICILIAKFVTLGRVEEEVTKCGAPFKRKGVYNFMIRYLCIAFLLVILLSSLASAFGLISM